MEGPAVELSVIVPTFNEREAIPELLARLDASLRGLRWEVIFVDDDSPDGTCDLLRECALRDYRIRCIRRIDRRGLSSACVEGMLSSSAPYLAVMDADLQHDETLLPAMLDALKKDDFDVVIGSRYAAGGGLGSWSAQRACISRLAARLSRLVVRSDLTDPMSGFFMLRRGVLEGAVRGLSEFGFKILLDLFASSPVPPRFKELPYEFRGRRHGESKLDGRAVLDYTLLVLDKLVGRWIPVRFLSFAVIGALGVLVHLGAVAVGYRALSAAFAVSQSAATLVAMAFNFTLNNAFTFRDRRLRGWHWLRGLVSFVLVCSVGGFANVSIAEYLFESDSDWLGSAAAGVTVGAVWNYAVSSVYTWNRSPIV
jgi:dolichol-phosphate mannosyltransferase